MRDRGEIAGDGEPGVLQQRAALAEAVEDLLQPNELLLGLAAVLLETGGDVRIVGEVIELAVDQRERLVLDAVRVLQPGDKGRSHLIRG